MRYSVVLVPDSEEEGYGVFVPLLPGCFTQGSTIEEALANARDAIAVHVRGLGLLGEEVPIEGEPLILTQVDVAQEVSSP